MRWRRRHAWIALGAVALVLLAGCSAPASPGGDEASTTSNASETVDAEGLEREVVRQAVERDVKLLDYTDRFALSTARLWDAEAGEWQNRSRNPLAVQEPERWTFVPLHRDAVACGWSYDVRIVDYRIEKPVTSLEVVDSGRPPDDAVRVVETMTVDEESDFDLAPEKLGSLPVPNLTDNRLTYEFVVWNDPSRAPSEDCRERLAAEQRLQASVGSHLSGAAGNGSLSEMVRFWNGSENGNSDTWAYAVDRRIGYGSREPGKPTDEDPVFGEVLNETLTADGYVYNVVVEYEGPSDTESIRMVYRGVPSSEAVVVEETITLYDNDTLTGLPTETDERYHCTQKAIEEIKPEFGPADWNMSESPDCYFAIPESPRFDDDDQAPPTYQGCQSEGPCSRERRERKNEKSEGTDDPRYNRVTVYVVFW